MRVAVRMVKAGWWAGFAFGDQAKAKGDGERNGYLPSLPSSFIFAANASDGRRQLAGRSARRARLRWPPAGRKAFAAGRSRTSRAGQAGRSVDAAEASKRDAPSAGRDRVRWLGASWWPGNWRLDGVWWRSVRGRGQLQGWLEVGGCLRLQPSGESRLLGKIRCVCVSVGRAGGRSRPRSR